MTSTFTLIIVSLLAVSKLSNARLLGGYDPSSDDKGRECATKRGVGQKCMINSHCCSGECAGFLFDRNCRSVIRQLTREIPVPEECFRKVLGGSCFRDPQCCRRNCANSDDRRKRLGTCQEAGFPPTDPVATTISQPTSSAAPSASSAPSPAPQSSPSAATSAAPTMSSIPSSTPSAVPSVSSVPTFLPSAKPSVSSVPSSQPSSPPSISIKPSSAPSAAPSVTSVPTSLPSTQPSTSSVPSSQPSSPPSISSAPSSAPTRTKREQRSDLTA
jgi:hypothetical protein